jgi:endonuclease/exonuclease/phosphatase family metal-dependent hydrolase
MEQDPANNWNARKAEFTRYVGELGADFICVQEAYVEQLWYIRQHIQGNYQFTGFGRGDGVAAGEYSAVFYRTDEYRFLDGDTFWLSDLPDVPSRTWGNGNFRVCTWGRFEHKATGLQFFVLSTHYDFSDEFHTKASQLINRRVAALTGDLPVFLAGDFNLLNTSAGYAYLENYGDKPLQDSYRIYHGGVAPAEYSLSRFNASYVPPDPNGRRIDFIFTSHDVAIRSCTIPKDSYGDGRTYSDHYPVVLDATLSTFST